MRKRIFFIRIRKMKKVLMVVKNERNIEEKVEEV